MPPSLQDKYNHLKSVNVIRAIPNSKLIMVNGNRRRNVFSKLLTADINTLYNNNLPEPLHDITNPEAEDEPVNKKKTKQERIKRRAAVKKIQKGFRNRINMTVDSVKAYTRNKGTIKVVVSPKGIGRNQSGEITKILQAGWNKAYPEVANKKVERTQIKAMITDSGGTELWMSSGLFKIEKHEEMLIGMMGLIEKKAQSNHEIKLRGFKLEFTFIIDKSGSGGFAITRDKAKLLQKCSCQCYKKRW